MWINQRDTRKEKYRAEWTCNRPGMDINTGPPTLDANRPIDGQLMNKVYGLYTRKMLLLESEPAERIFKWGANANAQA